MEVIMFTDGGSRGNPGPAAIGVVIKSKDGVILHKIGKFIGDSTNNDAEYKALVEGIDYLQKTKVDKAICYLDSELVVKQLNGLYKVKNPNIKTHWNAIRSKEKHFSSISYVHVKREKNKEADAIVNEVLDSALNK